MELDKTQPESLARVGHGSEQPDPLEKALHRIRCTNDFPTISRYVIEINQKLSEHAIHSSASELANIILKDYALTNKLLKLVNSAFYGFVAGKVGTVTRAVVLLGYDNVRLAAVSLVLFEHFKGRTAARDLKNASLSSFWCGLIAREIAKMQYLIDPEEAFICALLHRLGKLLVIYHMPEMYREIKYRVVQQHAKETKAVQETLGFSYRALGVAVARQWNFPERIIKTMAALSADDLEDKRKSIEPLCALSSFINALCRVIDEVRADRRGEAMENLLQRYHRYVLLSPRQLETVMASSLDALYKHADALQFSVDESQFLRRLAGNCSGPNDEQDETDDGRKDSGGPSFRLADEADINSCVRPPEKDDTLGIIMCGIQEISGAMMGDYDINDIALTSLEIIYRALQCTRAVLFINESRKKTMEARFGYGEGIQRIVEKVKFDIDLPGADDLFVRSIHSGKDLIVEDSHIPELHPLIPSWYRSHIDARAFVFLPILYQKICVGAYYADSDFTGPPVSAQDHKYLAMLRNQLILAIRMKR